jgi:AcrR family transcriptional regulator
MAKKRTSNPRGSGAQLRDQIIDAATRLLDDQGEDESLSLRAVAREVGVAATSVYLHFADRDELLEAVIQTTFARLTESVDEAEQAARDPAAKLRARVLAHALWAQEHFGLFKVLHESTLHTRRDLSFLRRSGVGTVEAVRRCIAAGVAPAGDVDAIALDLRTAVHGMVSMRLNQPFIEWPTLEQQLDRFLAKLVGISKKRARS